jgi:hypothetical protein
LYVVAWIPLEFPADVAVVPNTARKSRKNRIIH